MVPSFQETAISRQFWILTSDSHVPSFCDGMTPYCSSPNSTLLPVNQPSSHPFDLPAFRIVPVECNALSASSSSVSGSSLLRSRGFSSVERARRCRESGAVLGEDEVSVFHVTCLFIVVVPVDAWVGITFLQALRNWQILWLPYFLCPVHICLCVVSVSEDTHGTGLSLT